VRSTPNVMKRPSRDRLRPESLLGLFVPFRETGIWRKLGYLFSFIRMYSLHMNLTWLEKSLSASLAIFSIFSISSSVNRMDFIGSPLPMVITSISCYHVIHGITILPCNFV